MTLIEIRDYFIEACTDEPEWKLKREAYFKVKVGNTVVRTEIQDIEFTGSTADIIIE